MKRLVVLPVVALLASAVSGGEAETAPAKATLKAAPATVVSIAPALQVKLDAPAQAVFNEMPVGQALRSLAKTHGLALAFRPGVNGEEPVTLKMQKEPLRQVLAAICQQTNIEIEYGAQVVVRPSSAAERLDKPITLAIDGISFADLLRRFADRGVNYVVPLEVLDVDDEIAVRVTNVPQREVIEMAAHAVGLQCTISKAGVVSLAMDPERRRGREMMQHWREMRERGMEWRNQQRRVEPRENDDEPGREMRPRQEGERPPRGNDDHPAPRQEKPDERVF